MPSESPTWPEVLGYAVDSRLASLFTAMPGRVDAFDPTTQRASVQPLVQRVYYDENDERQVERHQPIHDVPVMFPGAGAYRITFPVVKGDTVLLVFTSCSLDRWLGRGGEVDPQDDRRNTLSDAIAIPGLYAFNALPTDEAPDDALVVHADLIKIGSPDADDPVVRRSDLQAFISGDFKSHVHGPGTFSNSGGNVVGASGGTSSVDAPDCSPKVMLD